MPRSVRQNEKKCAKLYAKINFNPLGGCLPSASAVPYLYCTLYRCKDGSGRTLVSTTFFLLSLWTTSDILLLWPCCCYPLHNFVLRSPQPSFYGSKCSLQALVSRPSSTWWAAWWPSWCSVGLDCASSCSSLRHFWYLACLAAAYYQH